MKLPVFKALTLTFAMAGLGPPEGEKTEKRGGERPGLWRVVGKAARAWRCAEWVRMCWSCWMIELNRTELNWTELNSTELNWIELNLFDCTDWLQLSIFKPKRPSIEWCMLFYARVTREWCEKIFIFFSILECVGTSGSERFCDLVVYIRYTRRESPHQGFHWLLTKSAGKDYTAFFPASAWNPRVMGPDIPDPTWVL